MVTTISKRSDLHRQALPWRASLRLLDKDKTNTQASLIFESKKLSPILLDCLYEIPKLTGYGSLDLIDQLNHRHPIDGLVIHHLIINTDSGLTSE